MGSAADLPQIDPAWTVDQLRDSYRRFRRDDPLHRQPWLDALLRSVEPSDGAAVARAPLRGGARRAVIAVNGLWEYAGRTVDGLLRLSHFQLIASLAASLVRRGWEPVLLDFRHGPRVVVLELPAATHLWPAVRDRPDWHPGPLADEAQTGYRKAYARLLAADADDLEAVVVEPSHPTTPVRALVAVARDRLDGLALSRDDVVIVAGGVLSPYLLEAVLPSLAARKFFYAMSFRNTSLRPHLYDGILTPVPDRPMMEQRPNHLRPGGLPELRAQTAKPVSRDGGDAVVVAIGLEVGAEIDDEFTGLLGRLAGRFAPLRLVVVGRGGRISPSARAELEAAGVGVEELGEVSDIGAALGHLVGGPAVVINPRVQGNAGSVLQAVSSGMPATLFEGNDAECALPASWFAGSVDELESRAARLLESATARRAALAQADEARRGFDSKTNRVLEEVVLGAVPRAREAVPGAEP